MNTEEYDQALAAKRRNSIRGRRLPNLRHRSRILPRPTQAERPHDPRRLCHARWHLPASRLIQVELNVTLNLILLVHNPNCSGFRHGPGKGVLLYRGGQVREADLLSGEITPRKSAEMPCRLMLEVNRVVGEDVVPLVRDVLGGEVIVERRTRIPGRMRLWKVLKRHVLAASERRYTTGAPAMRIQSQGCEDETKFRLC